MYNSYANQDLVSNTGTTQGISRKGFNSGNWRLKELSVKLRKQKSGENVISVQVVLNYGTFRKLPLRISASYNTHRDEVQEDTQKLLQNPTSAISRGSRFPCCSTVLLTGRKSTENSETQGG